MTEALLRIYRILSSEFGEQHWWPGDTQDEIIIGAVLTQNTNWANAEKAIANLKKHNLLSLNALAVSVPEKIAPLIKSAGYYNQKAKRLINLSQVLTASSLPAELAEFRSFLLKINGIGPETADSILLYAYGYPIFVVDAYTKRLFQRLGLIPQNSDYDFIQQMFQKNLPTDAKLFNEYHALIVHQGKTFCRKTPLCTSCPLRKLCKFSKTAEIS